MILETPHRRRQAGIIFSLCLCAALLGPALGTAETNSTSREIAPGLAWFHHSNHEVPWSIHVVQIDRGRAGFQFVTSLAQGAVAGLAPVSEQVRSLPTPLGEPLAAINGDFFRIEKGPYRGDPRGLQITRGELVSNPAAGACFWIDAKGRPQTGAVTSQLKVIWPNRATTPIGLNQECTNNRAVLFTPTFGPSTRTSAGRELVLEPAGDGPWLPLRAGLVYTARVREVRTGGDTPLTPGLVVLALGDELMPRPPEVSADSKLRISLSTRPDLTGVLTAMGGGPRLVAQGKPVQWTPPLPRHPRSAIGWNDRYLFFLVVDGRQKDLSLGMTFPELASYLAFLGCREAVNLDGGGSSTLWVGGRVVNSPSDGRERPVANALILLRKRAVRPNRDP
ncbi:MAG: phosphodiester glycosidase family protein [Chloroflexi bacterium]|nr:phosphodiester glycosidase family protein [Chloroflexota bacterium]